MRTMWPTTKTRSLCDLVVMLKNCFKLLYMYFLYYRLIGLHDSSWRFLVSHDQLLPYLSFMASRDPWQSRVELLFSEWLLIQMIITDYENTRLFMPILLYVMYIPLQKKPYHSSEKLKVTFYKFLILKLSWIVIFVLFLSWRPLLNLYKMNLSWSNITIITCSLLKWQIKDKHHPQCIMNWRPCFWIIA